MLSLSEVKEFLRIDHDAEDGTINILILLAKELAENYMRNPLPEVLPQSVIQAMLLTIAHFYENRTGEPVPEVVYRLLDPYREERF